MARRKHSRRRTGAAQKQRESRADIVGRIRARSKYPTYRSLTTLVLYLSYAGGAIYAAFGLWSLIEAENTAASFVAIMGVALGAIIVVLGKYAFEASSMLADCADSLISLNETSEKSEGRSERAPAALESSD